MMKFHSNDFVLILKCLLGNGQRCDGRSFAVVLSIVGRVHRQFRPEDQLPLPLETCNRKTNKIR
jgi:hypothetical protein